MKVGENPLYAMMVRYLELATEVVLEPTLYIKKQNTKHFKIAYKKIFNYIVKEFYPC